MTPPSTLCSPRSSRPPPLPGWKVSASTLARKCQCQGSSRGAIPTAAPTAEGSPSGRPGTAAPAPRIVLTSPMTLSPPAPRTDATLPTPQRGVILSSLKTTTNGQVPTLRRRGPSGIPGYRESLPPHRSRSPGSKEASARRSGAARKSSPSGFLFPAPSRLVNTGTSTGIPEPARARSATMRSRAARPSCRMAASSGCRSREVRALPEKDREARAGRQREAESHHGLGDRETGGASSPQAGWSRGGASDGRNRLDSLRLAGGGEAGTGKWQSRPSPP